MDLPRNTSQITTSLSDLPFGRYLTSDILQSQLMFLTSLFVIFIAYLSYTPRVDKNAPAFTSDTHLFVGSWSFFDRSWSFFRDSISRSKTRHFSFWVGKHHVVGVSGQAARKMYLDHRQLDFNLGNVTLQGLGPDVRLRNHEIFNANFSGGHTYFTRRLLDITRSEQLLKRLPNITHDSHDVVNELAKNPSGVTNPFNTFYSVVLKQNCRMVCTDQLADNPELLKKLQGHTLLLQSTSSRRCAAVPWLPSWSLTKRYYGARGIGNIMTSIVEGRLQKGTPRNDDSLQLLLDFGDKKDWIINFFISMLFVSMVNAGILAGALVLTMADCPEWQEKIYAEIRAACAAHSKNKNAPLVEQLDTLPLEAWESAFPTIDLCFKELIRINIAFPMFRKNVGPNAIPIPGSNEVIPVGSYACYNTTDVHCNEELYPNHARFDPERFLPERQEFRKQTYGFLGWGTGRHPCLGMRWAKLQQNINLGYAVAQYKWNSCDANGTAIPPRGPVRNPDGKTAALPQGVYCNYVARET